jgi:hypothetical protein
VIFNPDPRRGDFAKNSASVSFFFDFFFFVFLNIGNKSSAARLDTPEDGKQAAIGVHCSFCMLRQLTTNRQNVLIKIEGVFNHETQFDSQCGSAGHVNVRVCPCQRAPALQQLEPVKLNAQQRPETEKQEREERQEAGPATRTNRLLHLRMSGSERWRQ